MPGNNVFVLKKFLLFLCYFLFLFFYLFIFFNNSLLYFLNLHNFIIFTWIRSFNLPPPMYVDRDTQLIIQSRNSSLKF